MQNAIDQLIAYGLLIDGQPDIGRVVRVDMQDEKRGKKSGWYILHEMRLSNNDVVVVGAYGSHKIGKTEKIELGGREFTPEEKAEYKKQLAEQKKQTDIERKRVAADAAKRAERIWAGLEANTGGKSDYLVRKKVKPFGVRFSRGSIVVPVVNGVADLVGLQFIDGNGNKKFLTGTAKRGAFHIVGANPPAPSYDDAGPICIAEGYATAASIHMATGWCAVVAFDAGNLKPVAEIIHEKFSSRKIIICADDDSAKQDTGRLKGEVAAKAVGGCCVVPDFTVVKPTEMIA